MAQQVWVSLAMRTSQIRVPVQVLAALLLIQLLTSAPGKAADDSLSAWVPEAMWEAKWSACLLTVA